jgi:ribosomal protein S18 acetylase RimI-like enzyme
VHLIDWRPDMEAATVDLLARAFARNPLHIAAFGSRDVIDKNRAFFRVGLPLFHGRRLAAVDKSRVVGFMHWVESPACQLPPNQRLGLLPVMVRELGFRSTWRLIAWLSAWAKRDSDERHWHFGPIGVDPDLQGRGIGRSMMDAYCTALDAKHAMGFLETDKPENVSFYRKCGFEVVQEISVIGVTTYFMARKPAL